MLSCKSSLLSKVDNFRSGKFDKHDTHWRKVTRDPNILSITFSVEIEFADTPQIQHKARSSQFFDKETNAIKHEIDKLLSKCILLLRIPDMKRI